MYIAPKGARARARSQKCPAQNNAGLSLHRKYNGEIARTKRPMTPDRREIQSRKKEPTGMQRGRKRNDRVKVGKEDVSIRSLERRLENVYSLLYTKAAAALFYTSYLSIRFNGA